MNGIYQFHSLFCKYIRIRLFLFELVPLDTWEDHSSAKKRILVLCPSRMVLCMFSFSNAPNGPVCGLKISRGRNRSKLL